jgi:hypothetical protein
MSDWATERWDAELFLDPQWIVVTEHATTEPSNVLCVTSVGDDEAKAKKIASDHNACLGIESPATTVPKLVEVLRDTLEALESVARSHNVGRIVRGQAWAQRVYMARSVLAKTGKKP